MADERYDISITKEYLIRNKAKLLYISSATYSGDWLSTPHTHYCSELSATEFNTKPMTGAIFL